MIPQLNDVIQWWWQWMGSMFWQVSLLILLVTVIDMAIRRWAWPQVRYVLWGLVFLKLVIPPTWQMPTSVVSWLQPRVGSQISIQIESGDMDADFSQEPEIFEPIQIQDEVSPGEKFPFWQAALFFTWFSGMVAFLLVLSIRMARLRKRHRNSGSQHLPEWFHELLSDTAACMKLVKIPTVVFCENGTGPAVYGLFRPVLVLPDGYLDKLSKQQASHVLLHELCHLKRGDLLVHWCCLTLQAVYWFNPFVLWTRRQMRHVCEICCDLSVADILREKTPAYRSTLLSSARELFPESAASSLGLMGIFEEPFRLVSRLKWLEKTTWEKRKRKTATATLIGLAMVFCVMPMNGLSQPAAQSADLSTQSNQEASDSDQTMIYYEALVLEVEDETDFDIEGLETIDKTAANGGHIATCDEITIEGMTYPDLKSAVQGLSNISGVTILQTPKMIASNNHKATIEVGTVQRERNLLLGITPQLLENGNIHSDILLEINNFKSDGAPYSVDIDTAIVLPEDNTLVAMVPIRNQATNEAGSSPDNIYLFISHRIIRSQDQLGAMLPGETQSTPEEKENTVSSYIPMLHSWFVNKVGNISDLMAQTTFTPFSTNDLIGLKISDIAPDSVFNQIGIYENDLLTAVNSIPLATPDQMYEFLEGLKTSDSASLNLQREGQAVINQYRMIQTNEGRRTSTITLSRQQLISAVENQPAVRTQVTLTPYSEDDVLGMKTSDINENSLFRRMGIRNDDILTAVDGKPLVTIDQFYDFFENLQSSDAASLEIIRKGVVRNYEYRIR